MKLFTELLIVSAIFFISCFIYKGQQRLSCNNGQGWDGMRYYSIAEQYRDGATKVTGEIPFIKRIGTPFIVGKYAKATGKDLLQSALEVNLAAMFIVSILLLLWLRQFVQTSWIRLLLCLIFLMSWHVPLRFSFFYPILSDAWGAVWFLAGLLALNYVYKQKKKTGRITPGSILLLSITICIGLLFRETNIVLALAVPFLLMPIDFNNFFKGFFSLAKYGRAIKNTVTLYTRKNSLLTFIPLILSVVTMMAVSRIVIPQDPAHYSYIKEILAWFYLKSMTKFILALFIAYGPLLLLVPFYFKSYSRLLAERQDLVLLLFLSLFFGFVGGSDTERITYMSGFPVVLIIIGISMERLFNSPAKWWLFVMILLQAIALRFFFPIPDCNFAGKHTPIPLLTPLGSNFDFLFLYSNFGHYLVNSIIIFQYVGLFLLTGVIIYYNKYKTRQIK